MATSTITGDLLKEFLGELKGAPHSGDDLHVRVNPPATPVPRSAGTAWRLARSLAGLRAQIDAAAPHRSKASDGSIGDAAHFKKGSASDHNPWIKDGATPVVTAIDVTHDPARGCDAGALADALIASHDTRIKYIIWNRRIASSTTSPWTWRPYAGANPHDKHVHISVGTSQQDYDDPRAWQIGIDAARGAVPRVLDLAPAPDAGAAVSWGARVATPFKGKVMEIAGRLRIDPSTLMAIMAFETGRTFSPSIVNKSSGATGLIQFMPATAVAMGTTTKTLATMPALDQLDYVERYLAPYAGRMADPASAYMAVLWPKAVTQPLSYVLFGTPSKAYALNKGLDHDRDGKVTKAEAAHKVIEALQEGMRPENFG